MSALRYTLTFAAGLLMAAPAVVTAQSQTQAQSMQAPEAETPEEAAAMKGMQSEQRFMVEAYMGNTAEISLGQLAQQRGKTEQIKAFGQKLIDDHAKANAKVGKYLDSQQVQEPRHVSKDHLNLFTKLSEVSDAEFDAMFAKDLQKEHEKDIAKYQDWWKRGKNDDVRKYINETLPVLKDHLKTAKQLQQGTPGRA